MICEECGYDMENEVMIVYTDTGWICPECDAENFDYDSDAYCDLDCQACESRDVCCEQWTDEEAQ